METAEKLGPSQAVLRWVRLPQQARTRATLTRLLDAAEALLDEKSFDEISIAEIARRAGSSVGGFYRRFRDKEGLLHALHERFCDDARATTDEVLDPTTWAGAPLTEVLARITAFLVEIHRQREGLFRAFLLRGVTNESVRERTARLFQYMGESMSVLLRERIDEVRHPDPETAAAFALQVVIGTLDQAIHIQPTTSIFSDERLTEELTRVFTSYLGVVDSSAAA